MNGNTIILKCLDYFLAEDVKHRRRTLLYRARFMVAALLFTMLPTALFMNQKYWFAVLLLPLSALALLYRLKRAGTWRYAASIQSLVLLMTAFFAALGQKTFYTGTHHWIPWIIVFVSVMDGTRFAAILGVLAILESLILLHFHSDLGQSLGVFTSFDSLLLHLMLQALLVFLGVLMIALTFAQLNEQVENETQGQHIIRAQTTHKAALGELIGQLAHEVNNPLAIVHAASLQMQIMLRHQKLGPSERERLLRVIDHALKRLQVVTDGLKAFAGAEEQQPMERMALHDILHWVRTQTAGFAQLHGVTLVWKDELHHTFLLCRPEQLAFVLSSLVHDAVEAAAQQSDRRVWIELHSLPRQKITIQVRDRGVWRKQRGAGPGLNACRKLVQDHGGSLLFQRTQGENIFRLTLPLLPS